MKNRIALIIMLLAGTAIAFACLFNRIPLGHSFLIISGTLLFFYILGLIINGIITKINTEAEARAKALLKQKKEEEAAQKEREKKKPAAKEETPEDGAEAAETVSEETEEQQ
ncbi:MAG: hypothetical protein K6G60_08175 [Lachnospiraceae bacterium]|nr:hypothetical protein [Lachnospiraceae bacterium]